MVRRIRETKSSCKWGNEAQEKAIARLRLGSMFETT